MNSPYLIVSEHFTAFFTLFDLQFSPFYGWGKLSDLPKLTQEIYGGAKN